MLYVFSASSAMPHLAFRLCTVQLPQTPMRSAKNRPWQSPPRGWRLQVLFYDPFGNFYFCNDTSHRRGRGEGTGPPARGARALPARMLPC